jgi:hypothetical protein
MNEAWLEEASAARNVAVAKYGWAPGDYRRTCADCGKPFTGDKRATTCEGCAEATRLEWNTLTAEERRGRPLGFPKPWKLVHESLPCFRCDEPASLGFSAGAACDDCAAQLVRASVAPFMGRVCGFPVWQQNGHLAFCMAGYGEEHAH